jgi:hypothetical protein
MYANQDKDGDNASFDDDADDGSSVSVTHWLSDIQVAYDNDTNVANIRVAIVLASFVDLKTVVWRIMGASWCEGGN